MKTGVSQLSSRERAIYRTLRVQKPTGTERTYRRLALMCAVIMVVSAGGVYAQNTLQPYKLVDGHTAGVLPKANYDIEFKFYGPGMITGIHVGITDRFTLGLSYGGENLIGRGSDVRWNPYPGAFLKYRIFEERYVTPAVTLGFDCQGYGGIADEAVFGYDGFVYKAPWFFLALSKNYLMLKVVQIGFHGTVNYSLEGANDVTWPNFLGGIDIGLNEELALIVEYDFAVNDITGPDNDDVYFLPHRGFLNLGLRWAFTPNFHMELAARDILQNKMRRYRAGGIEYREPVGWGRELKVVYITSF